MIAGLRDDCGKVPDGVLHCAEKGINTQFDAMLAQCADKSGMITITYLRYFN
jgi:hypothetical protein